MNNKEILQGILDKLDAMTYIKHSSIPDIPLYMDQVTTFMNENLDKNKRFTDDKILTKTMINNYTKNRLIPPSLKKKYSKEHILLLIFIYYYKNVLGFSDIEAIFDPITEKYFKDKSGDTSLLDIYNECLGLQKENFNSIKEAVLADYEKAATSFKDADEDEREYLCLFAFICTLSFDIYVKKQVIEHIIDETGLGKDAKKHKK